jgi:hypothetical protein
MAGMATRGCSTRRTWCSMSTSTDTAAPARSPPKK